MKKLISCIAVSMLLLAVVVPVVAHAQENEGWKFSAGTMLWLAGLNMESTVNSTTVKGDQTFTDLLGKLEGSLCAEVSARKDKLSFQVDTVNFYLKEDFPVSTGGDREVKTSMNWLQGLVGYRVLEIPVGEESKLSFEPTAGYRYYWNRLVINDVNGDEEADKNPHWGDVVVGGRVIYDLNPKFSFLVSGTYGGFDWGDSSKYSWSGAGAVDWHFSKSKTLRVGYMAVSFKKEKDIGGALIDRASIKETLSGPVISLIWKF